MYISKQQAYSEFSNLDNPIYPSNNKSLYTKAIANKNKNRYNDILAVDKYIPLSDEYINASYIFNQHIACQAPLPNTKNEFWEMVWTNDVSAIVMLTDLIENRKIKAHIYYPIEGNIIIGNISIAIESISESNSLIVRKFKLVCGNNTKYVNHYHYKGWKDGSIPTDINTFVELIHSLRDQPHNRICVHCSAGIGRTGVFLATYIFLENYYNNKCISIPTLVNGMRQYRMNMVQTKQQYYCIYITINQYIKSFSQNNN